MEHSLGNITMERNLKANYSTMMMAASNTVTTLMDNANANVNVNVNGSLSHNVNANVNVNVNGNINDLPIAPDLAIPMYMYVSVTALYALIFLGGLFGNGTVIFVVLRRASMRTSTNVFLANLSVADVWVLLVCMPTALTEFYAKDVWYLGETLCHLVPYLENTMALSSVLTILAISLERYHAICSPLTARARCTMGTTLRAVAVVWLSSALLNVPFFALSSLEPAKTYDNRDVQVCRTHIAQPWQRGYILSMLGIGLGLPLIALVFIYSCIIQTLVAKPKDVPRLSSTRATHTRRKTIAMLVAVIILFFVSQLPFRIVSIWLVYASSEQVTALGLEGYLNLLNFARVMLYINSAVNPLIYNLFSTKFRNGFRQAFQLRSSHEHSAVCHMTNFSQHANSQRSWDFV